MKKIFIILVGCLLIIIVGVWAINYYQLQSKMNKVLNQDSRNKGIVVSVHFNKYVIPSVVVYDLKSISKGNSVADVFRAFLQFANAVKDNNFDTIILSYKGKPKFKIKGDYFKKIGKEYSTQNPIYVIRTFPENVLTLKGENAYSKWTGGILGVFKKQMEDFNDFNHKWYSKDMLNMKNQPSSIEELSIEESF